MIKCYVDGSCIENPGTLGSWGFIITEPWIEKNGIIKAELVTNNIAEFTGLIELLKELDTLKLEKAIVHCDSRLVVNIVNGKWKPKKSHLKPLAKKAKQLLQNHNLTWIPREENHLADEIATKAYNQ